jgi:hypothetical protein
VSTCACACVGFLCLRNCEFIIEFDSCDVSGFKRRAQVGWNTDAAAVGDPTIISSTWNNPGSGVSSTWSSPGGGSSPPLSSGWSGSDWGGVGGINTGSSWSGVGMPGSVFRGDSISQSSGGLTSYDTLENTGCDGENVKVRGPVHFPVTLPIPHGLSISDSINFCELLGLNTFT